MISVNGLAATMSYDVGYDVAQGVLLSLNICLFVAILFQFLVEYRVSQDQRLFQKARVRESTGDKTSAESRHSASEPTPSACVQGPPVMGGLQYWIHRMLFVAECVTLAWMVDPFGIHGLLDPKFDHVFGNCICSILIALSCYVLYTWLYVNYASAMHPEPRWLKPVLMAVGALEFTLLSVLGILLTDYRPWLSAASLVSVAVTAAVMLIVMTVSVLHLRGVLSSAAFATARRRMTAFMLALLTVGALAIAVIIYIAYDRLQQPDNYTSSYSSQWSSNATQKALLRSLLFCLLFCFFVYSYMPVSLLYDRPWAVLWEEHPKCRPTPSARNILTTVTVSETGPSAGGAGNE